MDIDELTNTLERIGKEDTLIDKKGPTRYFDGDFTIQLLSNTIKSDRIRVYTEMGCKTTFSSEWVSIRIFGTGKRGGKLFNWITTEPDAITKIEQEKHQEWIPDPEMDAFLLSTDDGMVSYFYAISADIKLKGNGNFYYKEDHYKEDQENKIIPSSEEEILDILQNHPEKIFHKCPCLVVMTDGHIRPLIERKK